MVEQDCGRTETDRLSQEADKIAISKRPRGSPTLSTPHRQEKRVALRELVNHEVDHHHQASNRDHLGDCHDEQETRAMLTLTPRRLVTRTDENITREKWSEEEVEALAEFVLFYTPGDKWPSHKQSQCLLDKC